MKMKWILRSFFCLTLIPITAQAEYLLIKKVGSDIMAPSEEEHAFAYDILQQYQFPMCLNSKHDVREKLNQQELNILATNEQAFIQQKLIEAGSPITLIFIPTTFYEYFLLEESLDNAQTKEYEQFFKKANQVQYYSLNNLLINYLQKKGVKVNTNMCNNFWKEFYKTPNIIQEQTIINAINETLTRFKNSQLYLLDLEDNNDNFINIIRENIETKFNLAQKKINEINFTEIINLLKLAIDIEINAQERGKFVLYRGRKDSSNGEIDKIQFLGTKNGTIFYELGPCGPCYGNSLFAGFLNDFGNFNRPACAFAYIIDPTMKIGYALLIDKNAYFDNQSTEQKTLNIPSLNTLAGFVGCGESFHPRIKENLTKYDNTIFQNLLHKNAKILKNKSQFTDQQLLSTYTKA